MLSVEEKRRRDPLTEGVHSLTELATLRAEGLDWKEIARRWEMRPLAGPRDLQDDADWLWDKAGEPGAPTQPSNKDYGSPEWDAWRGARWVALNRWIASHLPSETAWRDDPMMADWREHAEMVAGVR